MIITLLSMAVGLLGCIAWCVLDIRAYADQQSRYAKANTLLILESKKIGGEQKEAIMQQSGLAPKDFK